MAKENVTVKLAWRIKELAEATGLSVPFLRNEARAGNLKTRKVGNAVIVLDEDVYSFLKGEGKANKQEALEVKESLTKKMSFIGKAISFTFKHWSTLKDMASPWLGDGSGGGN